MNILISNGRVVDPANRIDAVHNVYVSGGKIVALGGSAGRFQSPSARSTPAVWWSPLASRPRRAPARTRLRVPRHARIRNGGGDGRRRHQPGDPA